MEQGVVKYTVRLVVMISAEVRWLSTLVALDIRVASVIGIDGLGAVLGFFGSEEVYVEGA